MQARGPRPSRQGEAAPGRAWQRRPARTQEARGGGERRPGPLPSAALAAPTSRCRCCPSGRPRDRPDRLVPAWQGLQSAVTGSEACSPHVLRLPKKRSDSPLPPPPKRLGRCCRKRIPCRLAALRPLSPLARAGGAAQHAGPQDTAACQALAGALGVLELSGCSREGRYGLQNPAGGWDDLKGSLQV